MFEGAAPAIPRVRSDVTPRVTLAGIASGLIQKEIHDITTVSADGTYVWNRWYPRRRRRLNTTARHVKLPASNKSHYSKFYVTVFSKLVVTTFQNMYGLSLPTRFYLNVDRIESPLIFRLRTGIIAEN